jgi:hypothetical protein
MDKVLLWRSVPVLSGRQALLRVPLLVRRGGGRPRRALQFNHPRLWILLLMHLQIRLIRRDSEEGQAYIQLAPGGDVPGRSISDLRQDLSADDHFRSVPSTSFQFQPDEDPSVPEYLASTARIPVVMDEGVEGMQEGEFVFALHEIIY